ncbi:unnamed protein product [Brassicogethes aeneus]|uniref:Protein hairless n=1 Tax=Brassicogethes aeneus TaxID=1431903 RepID=A0A9P0B229_BRAAE|nr:unnamed protein product [Brassicogethes aeneus]
MPICDQINPIQAKCTNKMKEEHEATLGMNGNSTGNIKEECHKNTYVQGGRLKFFKDGKFILELERAREGERVSWVSVPRKTFWPPQGTAASTPTYRQESSTSLSVSDDNSSVQSSPWQRDHSWKQTSPRRNQSKEMTMWFWRAPGGRRGRRGRRSRKRRRPYSTEPEAAACEGRAGNRATARPPKEPMARGAHLLIIVQNLSEKISRTSTPPRSETVVSPRKRFLREMEKDRSQPDDGCLKRSRSRPQTATTPCRTPPAPTTPLKSTAPAAAPGNSDSPQRQSPPKTNGNVEAAAASHESKPPPAAATSAAARNCSYSITSLLAEDRGAVGVKREQQASPGHHYAPPQHYAPPPAPPPPDDRWYSESVDKLRSIELSHHVDKRQYHGPPQVAPVYTHAHHPVPATAAAPFLSAYHHHHHHAPPPHPQLYPSYGVPSPFYGIYGGRGAAAAGGYGVPPAVYHAQMQLPPPQPPASREGAAQAQWMSPPGPPMHAAGGQREAADRRDEPADMPLNLSKHAG